MRRLYLLFCLLMAPVAPLAAGGACNDGPTALDDVVQVGYGAFHLFDPAANDFDSDGDSLSLISLTATSNCQGALTLEGPYARYTPNGNALPAGATFCTAVYTIAENGSGDSASASVTLVFPPSALFSDDFESGNASAWDSAIQGN